MTNNDKSFIDYVNRWRNGEKEISRPSISFFTKVPPKEVGLYKFRCQENGNKSEFIAITNNNGELNVHSIDLLKMPLEHFNAGLTDPMWKHIA
jgi:hypothetical protein